MKYSRASCGSAPSHCISYAKKELYAQLKMQSFLQLAYGINRSRLFKHLVSKEYFKLCNDAYISSDDL